MGEIKTPLINLKEGQQHIAGENDYVITENHTFSDIVRFMLEQGCDGQEMYILASMEEDNG